MNALLKQLESVGVELSLRDNRILHVKAPVGFKKTPEFQLLKNNRDNVIRVIKAKSRSILKESPAIAINSVSYDNMVNCDDCRYLVSEYCTQYEKIQGAIKGWKPQYKISRCREFAC